MADARRLNFSSFLNSSSLVLMVAVLLTVVFMIVPVPYWVIDALMIINLAIAFLILLSVINVKRAADFASFPQVVLLYTFFGLVINVSSTRNILANPVTGILRPNDGQCDMVKGICQIMEVDQNVVVGFIVFIIFIIVQLLVISKGADRVSEVSARFTLDAMNNRMFLIQQQMNSGAISEEEGNARISGLNQEIDFFSTMDGATKFVSGNVKAGIFITLVNLIGGVITGYKSSSGIGEAFRNYGQLTIGDGIMSQIPSLLLSFSTGILITKNSSKVYLSDQIKKQFSMDASSYFVVAAVLFALSFAFWNGASLIMIAAAGFFGYTGWSIRKNLQKEKAADETQQKETESSGKPSSPEEFSPIAKLDELSLELGYALIPLVDREKGAELLNRVTKIRREEQLNLGLIVPPIHIVDQMELKPDEYSFKIHGIEVGRSELKIGYYMCLNIGGSVSPENEIKGEHTKDPAFGMDAIWLPESKRLEAEKAGYSVIDPPTIIATHLTEIIRKHAPEILSMQDVSRMIDKLKETNSVVVDEVLSGEHRYRYGDIEKVLKNLLAEQVSIRNLVQILETLGDYSAYPRNVWFLSERVRESLGAQICRQYIDENGRLHVLNMSQALSQKFLDSKMEENGRKPVAGFDPVDSRKYLEAISSSVAQMSSMNYVPIVLCPNEVRLLVKSFTEMEMPGLVVLSFGEVLAAGGSIKVESLGVIDV